MKLKQLEKIEWVIIIVILMGIILLVIDNLIVDLSESLTFFGIFIPIVGGLVILTLTKQKEMEFIKMKWKAEEYGSLLETIDAFRGSAADQYTDLANKKLIEFLESYRKCWLFASKKVIKKLNDFLDGIDKLKKLKSKEKKEHYKKLDLLYKKIFLVMREELLNKKDLKAKDINDFIPLFYKRKKRKLVIGKD